ncbi:MAG: branched-chain amino acid ABC transporter permease [Rhizobiales bacterium]|nr:branched-chain amino acid ABC transporter permease [Hyphomicrobiales bacterium]
MDGTSQRNDFILMAVFTLAVLTAPVWLAPIGAGYPDLLQRFAIFAIFAVGFKILFGLTGYLSFGHAAFLGVGSYTAVWSFKLLSMNILPAIVLAILVAGLFSLAIGYVSLRRTGIYFSILTLAFAQMSYNLAYSVLTPVTNGETGLKVVRGDAHVLDRLFGFEEGASLPTPTLFGLKTIGWEGYYICAVALIVAFFLALRITRSPFGLALRGIKSNQARMSYTGFNTRPHTLAAFVISGMYAGLVIKYFENIFSSFNEYTLEQTFAFLPEPLRDAVVSVASLFVGEGWHLTLGLLFMAVVIFLPGGIMEGIRRIGRAVSGRSAARRAEKLQPAE